MKAIMIVFNQAHTDRVEYLLDRLGIRGYTQWNQVQGRGTASGDPRMGNHTWPEINNALLAVVEDEKVDAVLEKVKKLDEVNLEVGIRAFVWDVLKAV